MQVSENRITDQQEVRNADWKFGVRDLNSRFFATQKCYLSDKGSGALSNALVCPDVRLANVIPPHKRTVIRNLA